MKYTIEKISNSNFFEFGDFINPYEKNDFYEARTNNLLHPVKRSKSLNGGGWISTDYRNKIAIEREIPKPRLFLSIFIERSIYTVSS